jgi:DMSO reductase anchor subunit
VLHLGRPVAAWKALRNLRRSWLSREVALLGLYAVLALAAIALPALAVPAATAGIAGVYASARLYLVPGRPAWDSRLTVARFFATAAALGGAVTGHLPLAAVGVLAALAFTGANWSRLARSPSRASHASIRLEVHDLRGWTVARVLAVAVAVVVVIAGGPALAAVALIASSEAIGRWLFYVTAAPLDIPGAFRAGAAVRR